MLTNIYFASGKCPRRAVLRIANLHMIFINQSRMHITFGIGSNHRSAIGSDYAHKPIFAILVFLYPCDKSPILEINGHYDSIMYDCG